MTRPSKNHEPTVYNRIVLLRTDRGWSRQEFAEAVGIHYQTVGYLERGEYSPSLVLALRIAALFEVPVETIFSLQPFAPLHTHLSQLRSEGSDKI